MFFFDKELRTIKIKNLGMFMTDYLYKGRLFAIFRNRIARNESINVISDLMFKIPSFKKKGGFCFLLEKIYLLESSLFPSIHSYSVYHAEWTEGFK